MAEYDRASRGAGSAGGGDTARDQQVVRVTALRKGVRLSRDIYDDAGTLLLAAGVEITTRFLELLAGRDIHSVVLRPARTTDRLKQRINRQMGRLAGGEAAAAASAWGFGVRRLSPQDMISEAHRGLEAHSQVSEIVEHTGERIARGVTCKVGEAVKAVEQFSDRLTLDRDLLATIVSMQHSDDEYLFDHGVNVALLAMMVASQMLLPRHQVVELGLGAMLADIGMLRVPHEIRMAARSLNPSEREEIRRHPAHTLDCLEHLKGTPALVSIAGYQGHERCDGTGYPRRRHGMFIHNYARITMVVDAFAAMTQPRPHRPAHLPYVAAEAILVESSEGRFDRDVVRAFLDSVGLFPIGSIVELMDGTRAKVLRSNPGLYTKPVVIAVGPDDSPRGEPLDLATNDDLRIISALPAAEAAELPGAK